MSEWVSEWSRERGKLSVIECGSWNKKEQQSNPTRCKSSENELLNWTENNLRNQSSGPTTTGCEASEKEKKEEEEGKNRRYIHYIHCAKRGAGREGLKWSHIILLLLVLMVLPVFLFFFFLFLYACLIVSSLTQISWYSRVRAHFELLFWLFF